MENIKMRLFLIASVVWGTLLVCRAAEPAGTPVVVSDYQLEHSSRVRENMEWTTFFAINLDDKSKARAFFIGDSICRDYITPAAQALRGMANCTHWTTSRCVTDPLYLRELDLFLNLAPNAVICFNNGLHSQFTNPAEYETAYRKAVKYLKAKCPGAAIFIITCTPVKDDAFNSVVLRLNRTAKKIAEEEQLPVIDAYGFMNRTECGRKWRDGIHFNGDASKALGGMIAETVKPHIVAGNAIEK